jgi:hypothetical protein
VEITDLATVRTVKEAWKTMVPVKVGTGVGHEDRISENRRLKMKDGSEVDMRRAYSMPRDEDVASVGPIDPQIGLLRLDREDGRPLAVFYQFACHPIMNPPGKGNSANDPHAFVAGYTDGYIYYTPTVEQRNNTGYAHEDCDSIVAPEWQKIFEQHANAVLLKLAAP